MLTITADQQGVLNAGAQAEFVRVSVKDSGGTFRDLTTYPGFNAVKSVQWTQQVDGPHATCTVTFFRELYSLSLSPYMGGSALNRGFVPTASPVPLLAISRELKVECAIVAMDKQPAGTDWFEVFHGRIDDIDPGKDQNVEVTCRDLGGRLAQQYIKVERVYSYAVDGGLPVALRIWEANQIYALNEYLLPASRGDTDPGFNRFLKCSLGGTSGTTEPVWTAGAGQVDGTAHWDYIGAPTTAGNQVENVMQNILDGNKGIGDSSVALFTPSSPLWAITQFIQQREFTLDALLALSQQIGWDLRYKWRTATAQFELTLYRPTRVSPTVLFTFGPSDYGPPTQLKADVATIRNSIRVLYGDAADLWPDGTPKRKPVEVSDSASITKYGELWMEIQEDQTSQIDTSAEATTLANAALSDLKEPTAELDVPLMRGFPWVEINDYFTFAANGLHFDSDQSLAVTQYQHTFEGGKLKTTLQTRGLPTIGAESYLRKRVSPKVPPKFFPHQVVHFNGPKTPKSTFSSLVGGQRIQLDQSFDKRQLPEEYEVHVYPVSATALSSSTLKAVAKDRVIEVGDLIGGKTYYERHVARHRNADRLIRGQPSAEQSFVAGRASAGHIGPGIALGSYPLNGGFETRLDSSGLPDHWTLRSGTLGTQVLVMEDGNGMSGRRYMRLASSSSGSIQSANFPIIQEAMEANRSGGFYHLTWWRNAGTSNSAGATYDTLIRLLDSSGNEVIVLTAFAGWPCDDKKTHWAKEEAFLKVSPGNSTARDAQLIIQGRAGATFQLDVDEYRAEYIGTPWYEVGNTTGFTDNYLAIPGFANNWVNYDATNEETAAFRKDQFGRVYLKGIVKSGNIASTPIFTLPVGWRPPKPVRMATTSNVAFGHVEIRANGEVWPVAGSNVWFSLENISFMTTNTA